MPDVPRPLYMLAFDHREVLRNLMGRDGEDQTSQQARFADGKLLVLEALRAAADRGVPERSTGILVDEEYGAATARAAKEAGLVLAMPVEASRTNSFEFQYGTAFPQHVEAFRPDIVKALVFHNPDDAPDRVRLQFDRIREVSEWSQAHGYPFMLEILIRPTERQLKQFAGSPQRFVEELRPELLVASIAQFQVAGVEPRLWKVESMPTAAAYEAVGRQVRAGGRREAGCIILGNGAAVSSVEQWLSAASPIQSFEGFAVGRSVWLEPLVNYYEGVMSRTESVDAVARSFSRLVEAFSFGATKVS